MLIFKKLRYKNFLSSGDTFTEIDFLKDQTNLIIGSNGAGKSTILDALTFVLFNKLVIGSFRKINKPQLVNSINEKDCLVEIEFSSNNRDYLVRRGIKPNIFDITCEGNLLEKRGDDRDNQQTLEENILKVNYKSFTQIVILGSSTFVPFMQLTASNRRDVIEDLLDIRVFSSMSLITKERIRQVRDDIKILDLKRKSLQEKVEMQQNFIEEITKRGESTIKEKQKDILETEEQLVVSGNLVKESMKEVDKLNKKLEELQTAGSKMKQFGTLKGKIQNKISTITKNHKFFADNEVCPTCTQNIGEDIKSIKLKELGNEAKELKVGFDKLQSEIEKEEKREQDFIQVSELVREMNRDIAVFNNQISSSHNQLTKLKNEISSIKESIENQTEEKEKLDHFTSSLSKTFSEFSNKNTELEKHKFIFDLLKDGGVKTNIIRKYLPLINQNVNRYLQMMDFYINFNLDEEFNETVVSPIHERFSYSSFSEGEKMRIDLALLFTWREVARVRNSINTNLLIMDEVFDSSLDGFGTEEFLKIVKYVVKDANVFIISHKSELHERFDSVLKFEKEKGFSKLVSK